MPVLTKFILCLHCCTIAAPLMVSAQVHEDEESYHTQWVVYVPFPLTDETHTIELDIQDEWRTCDEIVIAATKSMHEVDDDSLPYPYRRTNSFLEVTVTGGGTSWVSPLVRTYLARPEDSAGKERVGIEAVLYVCLPTEAIKNAERLSCVLHEISKVEFPSEPVDLQEVERMLGVHDRKVNYQPLLLLPNQSTPSQVAGEETRSILKIDWQSQIRGAQPLVGDSRRAAVLMKRALVAVPSVEEIEMQGNEGESLVSTSLSAIPGYFYGPVLWRVTEEEVGDNALIIRFVEAGFVAGDDGKLQTKSIHMHGTGSY